MTSEKATIIDDLVDAAEYALEVLDSYADVDDGDDGLPTPNKAMIAQLELNAALEVFRLRRNEDESKGVVL